ncbi:peptidyl-prolyl cis-trans isomerase [Secundilactobacillus odoratitofui DSM 19909 = JCM 15043]|uniref:Peptidyl-prolyl cis-trans isomerase n=2 Tax=Secundilactobacillus odoratitofui TaxID=480930 RepID=A0A0R1LWM0_9LACO|nr:peptidylprolyl isomerase [Secundilactobacillus odoratitofui]KRK97273.1 peptidyl-prolyl cis-trans isomerase [Secundilactobacillus odoratitofui DSM 19909 = JCM 15043]
MIHTSMGDVEVQLFPEQAPKAVENFVTLAKQQYYDEVIFHRVISDFMIQGGDPTGTGMGGDSIWGEPFEDEFSKELYNLRGALSMANSGPNTNGSQFFIVQNQHMSAQLTEQMSEAKFPEEIVTAYQKGGTPWLDFRHTVFGQVVSGMDVVDKMAAVKTDAADKPLEDIVIESITITD